MSEPLRQDDWIYEDEDPETAARLDAEAEADVAAGRFITGEALTTWLENWAKGEHAPPPEDGA